MDPYSYSFESVDLESPSCGAGQEKNSWHETCTTNHKSVELTINFKKALYSENKSLKFISVYYTVSTLCSAQSTVLCLLSEFFHKSKKTRK